MTRKVPPSVSPCSAASSIAATMRSEASGSGARTGQFAGPVDMVLVLEDEGDRAADREAAPHAADDPRKVGLDLLATSAAMSALPPREIPAKIFLADLESGRQSLDHNGQLRAVGLSGRQKPEHEPDHRVTTVVAQRSAPTRPGQ